MLGQVSSKGLRWGTDGDDGVGPSYHVMTITWCGGQPSAVQVASRTELPPTAWRTASVWSTPLGSLSSSLAFRLDTLDRMSRGPALGEIYRPLAVVSWKIGK